MRTGSEQGTAVEPLRFEDGTATDEIAAAAALGDRRAVLLARHGMVAVGETPAAALATCAVLERQAQVAWLVRGAGNRGA